ncbi:MAG: hypothetical protein OET41_15130, partial [Xanthomonadales bacterium]|nr:hypothetical protein [Xanthomonadales bacterium]
MKPSRVDGGGLQVVEAGARLKVQTAVFRVGNQQAAAFEHAHDAFTQDVEQSVQFLACRRAGAMKGGSITGEGVGAIQEQNVQVNVQVE